MVSALSGKLEAIFRMLKTAESTVEVWSVLFGMNYSCGLDDAQEPEAARLFTRG
jgi:hypothetical protein